MLYVASTCSIYSFSYVPPFHIGLSGLKRRGITGQKKKKKKKKNKEKKEMSYNFKKTAQNALVLSMLMAGREKIETSEIIGQTLTIDQFDLVSLDGKMYPVVTFKEMPNKFYNGGYVLKKLVEVWVNDFNGDVEAASDALREAGGVKLFFRAGKTKQGNNLVSIDVVD